MKVTIIPNVIGVFGIVTNGLLKGLEDLEVGRGEETIQTIIENDQNTQKSLETWEDLLSLKLHLKNHQLRLMWKTVKEKLENNSHKLLWDINIQTDYLIPTSRPDLIIINKKKKRICKIVNFAVPADHRINLKESEKKDRYLDLSREFKKLWNMKVTIVPIVISALGTINKGLLKDLEDLEFGGRVESI